MTNEKTWNIPDREPFILKNSVKRTSGSVFYVSYLMSCAVVCYIVLARCREKNAVQSGAKRGET